MVSMLRFLRHHWFVLSVCLLVPAGFFAGRQMTPEEVELFDQRIGSTMSRVLAAAILFLMSFTLDNRKIAAAIRSPKAVLWASLINAGLIPLLALPLMQLQPVDDFRIGLMIAASVPCTMAAASMWTRSAGGNDAISLLVTTITNGACFLVAPFWLGLATGESLNLTAGGMILPLVLFSFVPIVIGQLVRLDRRCARFADRHKSLFTNLAQACIAIQILWVCIIAGPQVSDGVSEGDREGWIAAGIAWASCVGLHCVGLVLGAAGGKWIGFPREDRIAAAFAASQKTLPIGILIARDPQLLGRLGMPFAVFPMLMYHVTQLVIDTIIVEFIKPQPVEDIEESV
jgi:solute carrier family 10 (sodium/bile acid cotransporter), member 7